MENKENTKKSERSNRGLKKYLVFVTIINLILLAGCILLIFKNEADRRQLEEAEEEVRVISENVLSREAAMAEIEEVISENEGDERVDRVKTLAERGTTALEMLKVLFPQQMVVADEGAFHFFDINKSLKLNNYDNESFVLDENGEMTYVENGENTGYKGIDVSAHNGEIDWQQVASDNVEFTYIRAGIRGYGSGKLVEDERFRENIEGATNAGLNVGVYFFTQAINETEAVEEAEFLLNLISQNRIDIPIALDVEKVEDTDSEVRTKDLSKQQYTKNVKAFCSRIEEAGYETIIYGNGKTFMLLLDMTMLEDHDKWFADYIGRNDYLPYFPYNFRIWQYDSTGSCKGVSGKCDMNLAMY